MRFIRSALLLSALISASIARAEPSAEADAAFAEIEKYEKPSVLYDQSYMRRLEPSRVNRFQAAHAEMLYETGEYFLAKFPDDPRRWKVMSAMLAASARRDFSGETGKVRSEEAAKRRVELRSQMMSAQGVDPDIIGAALASEVSDAIGGARRGSRDLGAAIRALDELARRVPAYARREWLESYFLQSQKRDDPSGYEARVRRLASDANPEVAAMAKIKVDAIERKKRPLDLRFTDLDGREVDLAKYRGKVVLLDFWATWCVPCMEEMPTLKAVYQKYHDKGFEIVGITDDIPAADPANPRRGQFTTEMLKAFLARENMPWPQLWDRRNKPRAGPKQLLQDFDVGSLPTTLLFDQKGMLVTADNHGEKLEENVRKLLGL